MGGPFGDDALDLPEVFEAVEACERGEVVDVELASVASALQVCMMHRNASNTVGLAGSSGFKATTSLSKRSILSRGVWPNMS